MYSRYDNLDSSKIALIQVRTSERFKRRFKRACELEEIDMSELVRAFCRAWLDSEQYDPNPAPMFNRFDWAFERVHNWFRGKGLYRRLNKFSQN